MIHWPAIIKHDGEDELIYISSELDWQNDEEMLLYIFTDRDVLIDSNGQVFSLDEVQQHLNSSTVLATASLENVIELIQAHAAIAQACCIEKIQTKTIKQAIELVQQLSA
ncbi:DUF4144 family protein [Thalassomonas sp. M1454]|uniref:DUF4144 family protein n=1 Tax=Thalassomonas sp. M1454 TaxID=2594477 RepID=UPI00117DBE7B|nr:DUF4144 family protein [Thalassomonas sp. M1454]TRX55125.1 hypothetical protein FNN08_11060 [Thalassomonas sp. M1454]